MAVIILAAVAGLVVGSFLNACIWRMRHGVSVWRGRSHCPKCKKPLRWYELIPVVSFMAQRGQCRGCKEKIDWQYPLVEVATGILFVLGIINHESGIGVLATWYLLSILVVLFVYDLRYGLVPDRVVIPAVVVALGFHAFSGSRELPDVIIAIAAGAGFFAAQYYASRGRWIGAGDIRLGALMGAVLSWPLAVEGIIVSYIIGGVVGVALLATGKKKFGQTVPLGAFLAAGTAITMLYGRSILRWYLNL